ncbi:DUF4893 domain-containing protein [Sphingomonas sp. KR1UV-12]|uniref:DUF4893 domain-containing protein n=1 Tax=Sphingomonas aurea TaxID=3063994 RepID=A0ABT9EFZ5_9SPHN|nr:DUF4893 domain-containing protein [Sphingomonas sp. KR1UV-12]MDP1025890.1 DUF4893 domain-containing protein [Sphingomonas sp. KR1UV-12]
MSRTNFILALSLATTLAGCAGGRHRPATAAAPTVTLAPEPAWRQAIDQADAQRIEALPTDWATAREQAARRGARLLKAEGDLLKADAALDHPALPPGSYKCRSVTLKRAGVSKSPSFFCYVGGEAGERVSFTKQTGTALPGGWLYPDEAHRYVFLGARQKRAGDTSLGYGEDRSRDLVGVVERVGAFRWRLVLPGAEFQVYELTPVPVEQQGAVG